MRNSSLVEWCCAENSAGLKSATEAMASSILSGEGRGAFSSPRSCYVSNGGAERRENAGMSSARCARNTPTEDLRFPMEG